MADALSRLAPVIALACAEQTEVSAPLVLMVAALLTAVLSGTAAWAAARPSWA